MGKEKSKAKVSRSTDSGSESGSTTSSTLESNQQVLDQLGPGGNQDLPLLSLLEYLRDDDLPTTSSEESDEEWSTDELSGELDETVDWSEDELGREEQVDDDLGDEERPKPGWTRKSKKKGLWQRVETERDRVTKVRALREKRKGLWGLGLGKKEKKLKKKSLKRQPGLEGAEERAVAAAGWPLDPFALDVSGRLVDGPGLSPAELEAIEALSLGEGGRRWLSCAGFVTHERALEYLRASRFFDWLTLEAATRIQLGTLAYAEGIGRDPETPAYSLGRHYQLRSEDVIERVEAELDRDSQVRSMFRQTMTPYENTTDTEYAIRHGATPQMSKDPNQVLEQNNQAIGILERIFLLLQAGLQVYDSDLEDHVDLEGVDVCRALAHGGRINVRIPSLQHGQTGRELPEWLGLMDGGPVFGRPFGTHHMTIDGKNGKFVEDGGFDCNLRSLGDGTKLFGMDLSGGGFGNLDHNGDLILPDGAHGHMFFSFNPPQKDRDGALQIGIETTRPGAPSLVGYHHGPESTELTANPESTFGGHKTDKIGDGSPRQLGKKKKRVENWRSTNGRYVDLTQMGNGNWEQYLERLRTHWYEPVKEENPQQGLNLLLGPRNAPDPDTMRRRFYGSE